MRRLSEIDLADVVAILEELAEQASKSLDTEGIPRSDQSAQFEIDVRYAGQVLHLTVTVEIEELRRNGLGCIEEAFDALHERLYTFALDMDREIINLRAVVQGRETPLRAQRMAAGPPDASAAQAGSQTVYMDGDHRDVPVYDRARLLAGNVIEGPAIVMQLDSTTVLLSDHDGEIDAIGNILIRPRAA